MLECGKVRIKPDGVMILNGGYLKQKYIKNMKIDIIFNDKVEYAAHMPFNIRFILWKVINRLTKLWPVNISKGD